LILIWVKLHQNPVKMILKTSFFATAFLLALAVPAAASFVPDNPETAAAPAQSLNDTSFFKLFGLPGQLTRGYTLCPTGDGNIYATGSRNGRILLIKMTPGGTVLWSRSIDAGGEPTANVAQIIVDSEGKIVGCGNRADMHGSVFLFRYDPVAQQMMWSQSWPGGSEYMYGLLENGPGGEFIAYANPIQTASGDDAELLWIDRATGAVDPARIRRYSLGSSETFASIELYGGSLYAVGRYTFGSTAGGMRHSLSRLNPLTGDMLWSRLSPTDGFSNTRFYGRDLVIDDNSLISVFSGNDAGEDVSSTFVFLQKSTLDGDLLWVKKFDLGEWPNEFAEEVVAMDDGYAIFGRGLETGSNLFLLKTDKDGNPLWAKKFDYAFDDDVNGLSAHQGQLLAWDDHLIFTAYSGDGGSSSQMVVVKVDGQAPAGDSCEYLVPTPVQVLPMANPVSIPATLETTGHPLYWDGGAFPAIAGALDTAVYCFVITEPPCSGFADARLDLDSLVCSDGGISLFFTVCNTGQVPVPAGSFLSLYTGNPFFGPSSLLGAFHPGQAVAPAECRPFEIENFGAWFPTGLANVPILYGLINDGGSLVPPFLPDSLAGPGFPECDFFNNLDSLVPALPPSPVLELGVDSELCPGQQRVLDPGDEFFALVWQDGSVGPTFTVAGPGIFSVQATDHCGLIQRDTVSIFADSISYVPLPDLAVCPGGSVVVSAPGFEVYQWGPSAGLDCGDCPDVIITPGQTTSFTLQAGILQGCTVWDTFTVAVLPQPSDTVMIHGCLGQAVIVQGMPFFRDTVLTDTVPAGTAAACDSLIRYIVEFGESGQPFLSADTVVCPGETIRILSPFPETFWNGDLVPAAFFDANVPGLIVAEATDPEGCLVGDTVLITPCCGEKTIYVPNVFTPNRDGLNDLFCVFSPEHCRLSRFWVYDRWGNLLFESTGDRPCWDGVFRGRVVAPGVYVWMAEIYADPGSETSILRGDVTVLP
jgi:gliding motility-associated-like protein